MNPLITPELRQLCPLVLIDDVLFVRSRRGTGDATLVTARDVRHPLRRYCTCSALYAHGELCQWDEFRTMTMKKLANRDCDPVTYYVEYLVPEFNARDWGEEFSPPDDSGTPLTSTDFSVQLRHAFEGLPTMALPTPSLFVPGRYWLLASGDDRPGRTRVLFGGRALLPTGDFVSAKGLAADWHGTVAAHVAHTVDSLRGLFGDAAQVRRVAERRECLRRDGWIRDGDLVLINGNPPLLGHLLPEHRNRALGRAVKDDVAMVLPLTIPATLATPGVYELQHGRWQRASLPNGLCLGQGPVRATDDPLRETPGLKAAAYLRWAALRIASNRAFHENDL